MAYLKGKNAFKNFPNRSIGSVAGVVDSVVVDCVVMLSVETESDGVEEVVADKIVMELSKIKKVGRLFIVRSFEVFNLKHVKF